MICPRCGNLISYNSYFGAYYCSVCGEYFQEIKKTNADKIRGMSNEELAKLLCCTGWRMFEHKECLEWLQRPAGEEDKHEDD